MSIVVTVNHAWSSSMCTAFCANDYIELLGWEAAKAGIHCQSIESKAHATVACGVAAGTGVRRDRGFESRRRRMRFRLFSRT